MKSANVVSIVNNAYSKSVIPYIRTAHIRPTHIRPTHIQHDEVSHSTLEMAVLTLDENGTICECSTAADLLGGSHSKIVWQHVSKIVPQFAETALVSGGIINPNLKFLSHIGYQFELVGFSGLHIGCALFFNQVENFGRHSLRMIIRPASQGYALS
ncbi:MAG: hypothetical protein WBP13_12825 [Methylophilaceae bacterium]